MWKTLLLAGLIGLFAQSVQTQQRVAEPPIGPLFVRLSVAAVDARGNPVTDLKSDELKITDAGKPQQILYFHRDESEPGTAAKLAPGEYSNRNGGTNPRATVILFDLLNESMSNRGFGTGEIAHALQKLEATDYVYIYMLTKDGSVYPVHPVPPLNELLLPVVPWTEKLNSTLDAALRTVTQRKTVDMRLTTEYIGASYQALQAMAVEMAPIPGPKNLIWISHGVPMYLRIPGQEMVEFTSQVRALSAALERENVALVPVILGQSLNVDERETMETLATLTGGPPNISDDVAGAIHQALQAQRARYRVAYDPGAKTWDHKFHKIKMTCTRPGIRIQSEQGYTADDTQQMPEQAAIAIALGSPFDIREIGLRATIVPNAAKTTSLQMRVNVPDLLLQRSGDRYQGELVISTARYHADGQTPKSNAIPVKLDLTEKQRDDLLANGFTATDNDPLSSDTEKIRIVVYDRGSGSIGALTAVIR